MHDESEYTDANASLEQSQAQFEANLGLTEESLALAREQFDYQKNKDAERLKNITDSMASIKDVFGRRKPIYDSLRGESFKLNNRRLNDLQTDANRGMNFQLARSGNTGGSVEVDSNKDLAQRMGLAIGQSEIFAQSQADTLRSQDDALKSSLQGLAASGAVGGASMAGNARGVTQNRQGTAQYLPNIENTFNGAYGSSPGAQRTQRTGGF